MKFNYFLALCAIALAFSGIACSDDSTAGSAPPGDVSSIDGQDGSAGGDVAAAPDSAQDAATTDSGATEPYVPIPCTDNADCESGYCVPGPDGDVCTFECLDSCPSGWKCTLLKNFGVDAVFVCLPAHVTLCRPCAEDLDCNPPGSLGGARCLSYGDAQGSFCGGACDDEVSCPVGTSCAEVDGDHQCVPLSGQCQCSAVSVELGLATPCFESNAAGSCEGLRKCTATGLTECNAKEPEGETCNGKDDDCDGETDEGIPAEACSKPTSFGACEGTTYCSGGQTRCEAVDAAAESCNGADDDCDGEADEGFKDTDGDGAADCIDDDDDNDGVPDEGDNCPLVANGEQVDTDLDSMGDACDADDDEDGVEDADDCAPLDGKVFPGNEEACNGKDDDCDDEVDEGWKDSDGDGAKDCLDLDDDGDGDPDDADCAPLDPTIHHDATEVCDGVDNDCQGGIDGAGAVGCIAMWLDGDGDGYGLTGDSACLCAAQGKYTALTDGDCNDTSASVYPTAPETCNGADEDCDGATDEGYPDMDGDKVADCVDPDDDGDGDPDESDCAPLNGKIHHGAPESCYDEVDNNCDGSANDEDGLGCATYYYDGDDDGVGNKEMAKCLCAVGGKYSALSFGDCKDDDATVHPLMQEQCNGKDDNCSGAVDEGYPDSDADGLANCADPDDDNDGDPDETDCAPTDKKIHHAAPEACGDNIDNNCSGAIDEGC